MPEVFFALVAFLIAEDYGTRAALWPAISFSLAVVLGFVAIAIFAPLISPFNPGTQDLSNTFVKPNGTHLMGTDNLGRDWFSRILYGARFSLIVGIV